ncbi:hypothetical protein [Streptacidiphilus fuscans]|uniref:Cellulose synthase n=1 Tax=Streptacidiphilus fuscans TaxID=2789292 RepID=A0A931FDZ0_9ACTN|nr:hypothetical protein [Streptacidiphilus fuscans]MBF9068630.1 hypothetical protein [Streptacidiphilus fuscans]
MTGIICMALSAVGVVLAVLTATRGRFRSGIRWLAVALIPTGLWLTGLITVFRQIGHSLASWATHLVFDPRVWVGVVMLGMAVVLLFSTGWRLRRGKAKGTGASSVAAKQSAPAATAGRPAGGNQALPAKSSGKSGASTGTDLGDFSDIEEILKRRGI